MYRMATRTGAAHVVTTRREYKGRVYTTHLLRRSFREGGKVKNETLGNLSHLPDQVIDLIRRSLKGETFVSAAEAFDRVASLAHGHVQAVRTAMDRLGFERLIGSQSSRERDLVCAMVAARIIAPHTKLATTRWWHTRTLADELGVADADEDDLYAAMDWLLERQDRIEKKLASRHLEQGGLVLYDLSSSWYEGKTCPLAKLGYSRDGKKGTLQVNWGVVTDRRGCPVAVSVHEGNTADPTTLIPEIERVKEQFGIGQMVIVGDRGMVAQKAIDEIRTKDGIDWISALKTAAIRALVEGGQLQLDLFDERNLFELTHPDYPGERLVACRNPELARLRAHKREDLLLATEAALTAIQARVAAGRLRGADKIGLSVGKVVNRYKVAKHFHLDIGETAFSFARNAEKIAGEAALDGLYVVRTSLAAERMAPAECVLSYKSLGQLERAFRTMKTVDLKVRPIHHRLEDRVRAHILLCMLAYYVEWHMLEAWRELTFADADQQAKAGRDPVAPARRSAAAEQKARTHQLDDATPAHSFRTLLETLTTIVSNTCRVPGSTSDTASFTVITTPNALQRRARELLDTIRP
jgi:Transposase DDE domain